MKSMTSKSWQSYEELARYVLRYFSDQLGISDVEAKQRLVGASGTEWEIDAKGVGWGGTGFLVIECKQRTNARLSQATVGALAFTVQDLAAQGAVIVTSIGLQEGAEKVAKHCDFKSLFLTRESTFEAFVAKCGARVVLKCRPEVATVSVGLAGGSCVQVIFSEQEKLKTAEGAARNGGPPAPFGNSGATEGPPSVS